MIIKHIGYGSFPHAHEHGDKPASKYQTDHSLIQQVMCPECKRYIEKCDINTKNYELKGCRWHE